MRSALVLVVAACGGKQPPAAKVAEAKPPARAPAIASCSDVGVILRGEITSDDPDAGRAREQTIEKSCKGDKWPQAIIDCVASTARAEDCLDKLSPPQRTAYAERLEAWDTEYGGADYSATGTTMNLPGIDCANLVTDPARFSPVIDPTSPEADWHADAREALLLEECEHGWSDGLKQCIELAGAEAARLHQCFVDELAPDELQEIDNKLANLSSLAAKIAAAKKKPASITCKKVVQAHYADARWKDKLDGFKPVERKKLIAASRDAMTKACTADGWGETQRACILIGGGHDCFTRDKLRWGYPATGTVTTVGIAECDEYAAAVTKLTSCNLLSQAARDSITRSQQQMLAEIARMPAAQRAKAASSCKAAMDAISTSSSSVGC